MVKKLKWIGIIIIIGISIFYGVKSLDRQKYYHRVIESGYVSDFDTMIIDTYDEYKNLISLDDEDSSKAYVSKIERSEYDKDFFEKNSLALAFKSYHPSDALAAVNLLHTGAHLNIMTTIQYASGEEAMTDEISGFIVLVEVGKDVEEVSIY